MTVPQITSQSHLILGEGQEEVKAFTAILSFIGRTDIRVESYGGKPKLRQVLKALPLRPDFQNLVSIAVTQDADENPSGAFDSICYGLKQANLPFPANHGGITGQNPRVGVFVLPDGNRQGMLEDLFWDIIAHNPEITCIDNLFQCLKNSNLPEPCNKSKARMNVWLAIQQKSDKRLGDAALSSFFQLDHPSLHAFIHFIQTLTS